MSIDQFQYLLDRYVRDRSDDAFAELAEVCTPLLRSVCRRYLRQPADIQDVQQAVLLKLARQADRVEGSLTSWLTQAARWACIDLIRRAAAGRRNDQRARTGPNATHESLLRWEAAIAQLQQAMDRVDQTTRHLLADYFLHDRTLRDIAADRDYSLASASRRVKSGLGEVRDAFHELGFRDIDDLPLEALLANEPTLAHPYHAGDGLRFAADWRRMRDDLARQPTHAVPDELPRGWPRPIRVGVFVGRATASVVTAVGFNMPVEGQLQWSGLQPIAGYDFVSVVEPGTDHFGDVERTIRRFDLLSGVIDATDVTALRSLDVLMVGNNFMLDRTVLSAFHEAVRCGVGFYSQGWLGHAADRRDNADLQALLLADGPAEEYHHPDGCARAAPMMIRARHSVMGSLRPGDMLEMPACGLWVQPKPGTRVLVTNDQATTTHPRLPRPMPLIRCGQVGRGRVLVCPPISMSRMQRYFTSDTSYFAAVFRWLAASPEPNAAAHARMTTPPPRG